MSEQHLEVTDFEQPSIASESEDDQRFVRLGIAGAGIMGCGSVSWAAGMFSENSSRLDAFIVPSAAVTMVGVGLLAVGSILHHKR